MPLTRWFQICALSVGLLSAAASANAATMLYASVDEMTDVSDVVVYGTVADARTFIGELGHITTEWSVNVDYTFKGEHADVVRFEQWGGELDGNVEYIPGDGQFEVGEDVVLFLRHDGDRMFLTAMGQAVFHVTDEQFGTPPVPLAPVPVSGSMWVRPTVALDALVVGGSLAFPGVAERTMDGVGLYDEGSRAVVHGAGVAERMTLAELAADITAAVADGEVR